MAMDWPLCWLSHGHGFCLFFPILLLLWAATEIYSLSALGYFLLNPKKIILGGGRKKPENKNLGTQVQGYWMLPPHLSSVRSHNTIFNYGNLDCFCEALG